MEPLGAQLVGGKACERGLNGMKATLIADHCSHPRLRCAPTFLLFPANTLNSLDFLVFIDERLSLSLSFFQYEIHIAPSVLIDIIITWPDEVNGKVHETFESNGISTRRKNRKPIPVFVRYEYQITKYLFGGVMMS